ncbi:MAG: HD domain-containing protein [Paraclostridium bifermentans]|uniref:HD domain-containing protein n=1 Tax=Paraclostridium bifermentans TaxID=1490 RepID=UPI0011DD4EEB|nr:HD domain-containing protein [Paraclostridium bifermentans]MBS6509544.1 HD domain-containing protein [Paraclostridium bifermentans]MDU3803926.1 HD domain-containing protein [Paraclostridium bifermentans]
MTHKKEFLKDIDMNKNFKTSLMVMKKIHKDSNMTTYILTDRSEEIKARISNKFKLKPGQVIEIESKKEPTMDEVKSVRIIEAGYELDDYLPKVKRPIQDILKEIEDISDEYIKSEEAKILNDYFFKDEEFLDKFKKGIGGVSMHHNYIGGLAEHTLGVMYLSKVLCDRYNCKNKEVTVLGAKLHDIGKLYELEYRGPFKYTLQGELEGHIAIGVQMIDKAINEINHEFSEDFIRRVKGCIIQHHGKLEYGSPRECNMEESFIINFADGIDATMNKINQIKDKNKSDGWSDYDRRLETRLYL